MSSRPAIVLASRSPQRRVLLERLGIEFTVRAADVPEIEQGSDPAAVAIENALRKARAAAHASPTPVRAPAHASPTPVRAPEEIVIGCDTIVVLDGVIYGKPPNAALARRTLAALGGHTHEVLSGLAVVYPARSVQRERTALARTRVTFRAVDEALLDWYVATEEWRGRSGGYAIQGAGARLATEIEGEEENVVGLPLQTLIELCATPDGFRRRRDVREPLQIRWHA